MGSGGQNVQNVQNTPDTPNLDHLDQKLLHWCGVQNLLNYIFGPSIHREIVTRSAKLLVFLTEYDFLKRADLHLIWKAAMDSTEIDIVEEVFLILETLTPYLKYDLFSELMGLAMGALKVSNYHKIAQFVEKFSTEGGKHVRSLSQPATAQVSHTPTPCIQRHMLILPMSYVLCCKCYAICYILTPPL
jgi:hypothetical protein